jgi:hypothetical protein
MVLSPSSNKDGIVARHKRVASIQQNSTDLHK